MIHLNKWRVLGDNTFIFITFGCNILLIFLFGMRNLVVFLVIKAYSFPGSANCASQNDKCYCLCWVFTCFVDYYAKQDCHTVEITLKKNEIYKDNENLRLLLPQTHPAISLFLADPLSSPLCPPTLLAELFLYSSHMITSPTQMSLIISLIIGIKFKPLL